MKSLKERFEEKYCPEPMSGCWLWTGPWMVNGYGTFRGGRNKILAHRASWEIYRGPIPEGLHVLHKCDVRECCNPDHLFLGSHSDNMSDMAAKGRQQIGERHWGARLSATDVSEIRRRYLPGQKGNGRGNSAALATEFGVDQKYISEIARGDKWGCV